MQAVSKVESKTTIECSGGAVVGLTSRGELVRGAIIRAASDLYAQHGVEATSLVAIAERAEVAIGSLTHFYPRKENIAAAVREAYATDLASALAEPLRKNGPEIPWAIKAAHKAYVAWARSYPLHPELFACLSSYLKPGTGSKPLAMQGVLQPVLADWAGPIMRAGLIAPMSPSQLYAVIMAPTIASWPSPLAEEGEASDKWLAALTKNAVEFLMGESRKRRRK